MARGEFNGAVPAPSVEHGYHFHFGNIEKRVNSTKAFDYTKLPDVERCDFKQTTSMERPVIYVTLNSINISPQWNYCQCEETASFYWIRDISIGIRGRGTANIWQFTLELDPLATYRDEILKTDAFIEYGFNQDSSGATFRLQDTRQAVGMAPKISTVSADITDGNIDATGGTFVLSCVGKSGLHAYAMSAATLGSLLTAVSLTWETFTKPMISWELALPEFMNKLLFGGNALECVRSCIWIPIALNRYGAGRQTEITLGQFNTTVFAQIVTPSSSRNIHTSINIPWPVDDWKRMNCQLQLYVPFVGTLAIPVDQCNTASSIEIDWSVCFVDGSVTTLVRAGEYTVYAGSTSIASPYGIGTSNIDPVRALTGAINTVTGAMNFGGGLLSTVAGFAGGTAQAAQGMAQVAQGVQQTVSPINCSAGTLGGASQVQLPLEAKLTLLYYPPVDDAGFQKVYGYPVMKVAKPVQGYCKTRGFSCAPLNAKPDEISYINAAMDSGVFIE